MLNYITSLQRADFRYHEGGSLPFLSSSEEQWGRPQKISEGNTRLSLLGYTLLWGNLFGGMIWKKSSSWPVLNISWNLQVSNGRLHLAVEWDAILGKRFLKKKIDVWFTTLLTTCTPPHTQYTLL